jgi:glutaredoxin
MTDNVKSYHIYTILNCPACKRAIKLLEDRKENFAVTVLDNDQERLQSLKEEFCWQTVPMIVGKTEEGKEMFLGGCSDLERRFDLLKG